MATSTAIRSTNDYRRFRAAIIAEEEQHSLGKDLILNADEKSCNEKLLAMKRRELYGPSDRQPWQRNFLRSAGIIEASSVFQFIKKLPKGASLHSHLYASASYKYVVNDLLYRDDIYVCNIDGRIKLKFLAKTDVNSGCESLADKRNSVDFDDWLDAHLLVKDSDNVEDVWNGFRKIFTFTYDLFSYVDVLEDYIHRVLLEHYLDNVMYVEVRTPFVPMYDLKNTTYDPEDFVSKLWDIVNKFKRKYPDFVGMKIIYAPYRASNVDIVKENFKILKRIAGKYPGFIAGIDLVGFEEEGTLLHYLDELQSIGEHFPFYFHAGETNRHGAFVDHNILDAILLGSKRIGHALALPKHPSLMRMVKEKNIAVEVCPISNQMLGFVSDLRNHPATYLISRGYPVVVCNDDPGNWGAEGLSYDWYLAFMAMSGENAGLELLKKLAMNSIEYSALDDAQKALALKIWTDKWNQFISDFTNEI
ncbi:adenosine deaminase [Holotrichia oblita]|uniref:Adenosine deaminase n=1 Tax=Holotrichia oblita TaxID=644536 RepID=A0ACB9TRE3_HOLOL|nr:adenosine deaminase [Holotrichia oblita]